MRIHALLLWLALILPSALRYSAIAAETPAAAQYHFVGAHQLSVDSNASKLVTLWKVESSQVAANGKPIIDKNGKPAVNYPAQQLFDASLTRLAYLPGYWYSKKIGKAESKAELIRPLFQDLATHESVGYYDLAGSQWSWLMAIRVTEERSGVWGTSLMNLFKAWQFGNFAPFESEGFSGWEYRQANGNVMFRYSHVGSWCCFSMGNDGLPRLKNVATEIRTKGSPQICTNEGWFSGYLDLGRMAPKFPLGNYIPFLPLDLNPAISLKLSSKSNNVRTKATLHYPSAPYFVIEPWKIPTNTIRDPLVGLTAIQGIRPWLERQPILKQSPIKHWPNQLTTWMLPTPFGAYAVAPMPEPEPAVRSLADYLIPLMSPALAKAQLGAMKYETNSLNWVVQSLELLRPALMPLRQNEGEFLHLVASPMLPRESTEPAPQAIFDQILGQTNLFYYDWEITEFRLLQTRILIGNSIDIYKAYHQIPPTQPTSQNLANEWIHNATHELGNTVTEARLTTPWDITINRSSHLGLSGLEITLLARWLDSPDFPFPGVVPPGAIPAAPAAQTPPMPAAPATPAAKPAPVKKPASAVKPAPGVQPVKN